MEARADETVGEVIRARLIAAARILIERDGADAIVLGCAEEEHRLQARKPLFSRGQPHRTHMEWRDEECAFLGTRRLIAPACKSGQATHILHVSTAEELDYLRGYRDIATVEVLVNHLTKVAPDCYDRLGVMNTPIRSERHRAAAWAAGRLSLARLVDLMAACPARVYGLPGKGRIAAGYDADFTLVDLKALRTIKESWIVSPCGWTPFAGTAVTGWPMATIVRGQPVMRDDTILGSPRGGLARFAA
ncbi:amidohydrolase family protein [Methylobacterium sp. ARG-1]|uniref:amidohydrolase family protein n=1 Tax=Methylobacterium sp. ARG-1 TaxID=1692501 RepID=UPI000B334103|nr:amidohydrolase family protein [Methylobacterium sp. ARG-1]